MSLCDRNDLRTLLKKVKKLKESSRQEVDASISKMVHV
jgi:hypothetical protein